LNEIVGMLAWGGFSGKARFTKQSPLQRMVDGGDTLNTGVFVRENTADGMAPAFQSEGFVKPPKLPLVEAGKIASPLLNPRTAREHALAPNGANAQETPEAVEMDSGTLAE